MRAWLCVCAHTCGCALVRACRQACVCAEARLPTLAFTPLRVSTGRRPGHTPATILARAVPGHVLYVHAQRLGPPVQCSPRDVVPTHVPCARPPPIPSHHTHQSHIHLTGPCSRPLYTPPPPPPHPFVLHTLHKSCISVRSSCTRCDIHSPCGKTGAETHTHTHTHSPTPSPSFPLTTAQTNLHGHPAGCRRHPALSHTHGR